MTRREREEVVLEGVKFLVKDNPSSNFKVYSSPEDTHAIVDTGNCKWRVTAFEGNWKAETC